MVRRRHRRPDRAFRVSRAATSAMRSLQGNPVGAAAGRDAPGRRSFPTAITSKCSARATPTTTRWSRRRCGSRRSSICPSSRRIRCSFSRRDDFRAHEARVCIAEGYTLADARRPKRFTAEQYFTSQDEMAARFADLPEALANASAIAQRCNLAIPLGKNYLPDFPTPAGVTIEQHLQERGDRGPRAAPRGRSIPTRPSATRSGRNTSRGSSSRRKTIIADGLCRLLPDRRGLHQLGEAATACRSGPDAAPARVRWSRIRSASPTSIRCATRCCSSASSIRSACRCPTSTSTSARTAATA